MSEKVRALNLTAGNMNMLTTSAAGVGGGVTLIGAPTLISSTFTATTTQSLTPTATVGGGNSPTPPPPPPPHQHIQQHHHHHSGGSDTESSSEFAPGAIMAQLNFHLLQDLSTAGGAGPSGGVMSESNSIMNSSQISATSNDSIALSASPAAIGVGGPGAALKATNGKHLAAQSVAGKSCRFPKLEECAHFHYERVQLGPLSVRLVDDKSELLNSSIASQSIGGDIANGPSTNIGIPLANNSGAGGPPSYRSFSPSSCWFIIKVMPHRTDPFLVRRSFDNMQMLDEMLHRCVYDRKISGLRNLNELDFKSEEDVEYAVAKYLERFSKIASDSLTCGTILTWFQLDNKGRRLPLADGDTMRSINTPAVGAAYGVRRYMAQASDEISIEVGDMISVIDMPSPAESIWWRGKKSHLQKSHYEVGFFPQSCVATIGDKVPRHFPMPAPLVGQLDVSPTKPVLRKHGKLIAFFRSFILSRPSRRRLKQSGIYRERVFSCDLSEHLLNSGQEIPMVLKCCAEFLEDYGIVDGIYRLSGITSNIQRLRRAFDEERIPDLGNPEMKQDIHAVSSLLKMYFRELPNPLCTYQLYDNFVEAIQEKSESNERLRLMKETVLKLPPPHYRTLKYLATHLNKISQHSARTGMTDKNLAIVWAPNLLRSPALESGGVAALRGVGVQAVVTEYLIRNCHLIFDALDDTSNARLSYIATMGATPGTCAVAGELRMDSLTDCESLLVEQREHDQSLQFIVERPKSLSASGPKLISLEEAQERHSRLDGYDMNKSMPINMTTNNAAANIGSYIEVGGGPSSLPDKYHTVLPVPRSWQKRKTHSWKSLFSRNQRSSTDASGKSDLKSSLSPSGTDASPPPHHKEATQVTFAESDAIITHGPGGKPSKSLLKHQDKTKSIELYDTSRSGDTFAKPMEICVRSSSIDSLRTAGHSRSVSHDSYFDLLQSPQRGHMATTCPSRELSELGLNFDREEPEMRIFSESESLVSSPRVGKENIPPASATGAPARRILRARPEEFSTSQTNSVNPSPKKQPRLNLLLSPSNGGQQNWSQSSAQSTVECNDPASAVALALAGDESCCKRYKLEDQLSDIQFIDCSTPEHTIAANLPSQTQIYTSVQVHNPPRSSLSKSSLYSNNASETTVKTLVDNELLTPTPTPTQSTNGNNFETLFGKGTTDSIASRYSYPTVQLGAKRKDQESNIPQKERFSYPGSNRVLPTKEEAQTKSKPIARPESMDQAHTTRTVSFSQQQQHSPQASHLHNLPKPVPELLRPKNRYSYCDTNSDSTVAHQRHSALTQHQLNFLLMRSSSTELTKPPKAQQQHNEALERMRHSEMTPSSPPSQSPRYSLLVGGDTSSENSSAVNTPQYDLEPLMLGSAISGMSGHSGHSATSSNMQLQQHLLAAESTSSSICLGASRESLGLSNMLPPERRDMHALKRELSLDLKLSTASNANGSAKMCVDHADGTATLPAKLQLQHQLIPSPNNSNFTDNTSQSVTPSEYGYQQLQRQSSLHSSLVETAENSPNYEDYENTPSNLISPLSNEGDMTAKLLTASQSPIKSTISITYNLKSPLDECSNKPVAALREKPKRSPRKQPLLETSFDENTVYEQVKLFRNSVTEVNQLLNDDCRKSVGELQNLKKVLEEEEEESLLSAEAEAEVQLGVEHKSDIFPLEKQIGIHNLITLSDEDEAELLNSTEDVDMQPQTDDSLETFDKLSAGEERLLYENVELRKPKSFYENMSGEEMKSTNGAAAEDDNTSEKLELELDSLDSIKSCEDSSKSEMTTSNEPRKSPSNFSVKQLANKFESSPVEQLPAFDFSVRSSVKKYSTVAPESKPFTSPTNTLTNTVSPVTNASNSLKQKLNKTQQITRSLDENAFVREFGAKQLLDLATKSTQQLPEYATHESTAQVVANRRKSYDFTRPKTLNPPKRLPGMPITEEICAKSNTEKLPAPPLKLDLKREKNYNNTLEQDFDCAELKITPTTENRISLIQHNVGATLPPRSEHLSNSNSNLASLNSLKVLSGVKLDRERIDKIKEERRQQLTQKYRAESFKSRSKTDLNSPQKEEEVRFHAESLRVKSKSRGDMRTLQKDIDNLKEFGRSAAGTTGSETTLNHSYTTQQQQRVRSISDEKNQNCELSAVAATTATNRHPLAAANANASNSSSASTNTTNSSDSSSASDDYSKRATTSSLRTAAVQDEFSARATVQKFERKSLDYANGGGGLSGGIGSGSSSARDRRAVDASGNGLLTATHTTSRNNLSSTREKISPQFSIRDVTAMFESRSQNQQ